MSVLIAGDYPVTDLPGKAVPYVLEAGSGRAHTVIDTVGRTLVGAEESNDGFAFMSLVGEKNAPIPLHYHDAEYEFFYCFDGQMQLWTNDESRVMAAGDFGYVPPGTIHAFHLQRHGSSFVGPVFPAGWERWFDLMGEEFSGQSYPQSPYPWPAPEKWKEVEVKFPMKFDQTAKYAEPTVDAPDDTLPGERRPYFLRRGEGTRHILGSMLQTSLCTSAETEGNLAMSTVQLPKGATMPRHSHAETHEVLLVLDGCLRVELDGEAQSAIRGDTISIPNGCVHSWTAEAQATKFLSVTKPAGLEQLFVRAGAETEEHIFPQGAILDIDRTVLTAAADGLDIEFAA